jgi:histidinol phosphatase-like enzyme
MNTFATLKIAVFLERNDTMIVDKNHLKDLNDVELVPGTKDAISNLKSAKCTLFLSGVSRPISMTNCDKNETKLNMPLFRFSIVMTFVQGNPFQPFNPIGENRP